MKVCTWGPGLPWYTGTRYVRGIEMAGEIDDASAREREEGRDTGIVCGYVCTCQRHKGSFQLARAPVVV